MLIADGESVVGTYLFHTDRTNDHTWKVFALLFPVANPVTSKRDLISALGHKSRYRWHGKMLE